MYYKYDALHVDQPTELWHSRNNDKIIIQATEDKDQTKNCAKM